MTLLCSVSAQLMRGIGRDWSQGCCCHFHYTSTPPLTHYFLSPLILVTITLAIALVVSVVARLLVSPVDSSCVFSILTV
jgi:hypothetical protein